MCQFSFFSKITCLMSANPVYFKPLWFKVLVEEQKLLSGKALFTNPPKIFIMHEVEQLESIFLGPSSN